MKFHFQEVAVKPEGITAVNVLIEDPATEATVEMAGEMVMFTRQWLLLKSVLIDGTSRFLGQEVEVEFRDLGEV